MYNLVWLNSCCARAQTSCPYTSKNKIFTMCNFQQFEELWKKIKEKKNKSQPILNMFVSFSFFTKGRTHASVFKATDSPAYIIGKRGNSRENRNSLCYLLICGGRKLNDSNCSSRSCFCSIELLNCLLHAHTHLLSFSFYPHRYSHE